MESIIVQQGLAKTSPARVIRQAVFVEEQGFANEFDAIDDSAYHVVLSSTASPQPVAEPFPRPASRRCTSSVGWQCCPNSVAAGPDV